MSTHLSHSAFALRPIRADDWEQARCVRLAALADAPYAFEATLAEEVALPDSSWRARAAQNAAGHESRGFFVEREGVPCGVAVALLDERSGRARLNALWVAENVRRYGLGRTLVQAVCDWARTRGASGVELEVTTQSRAARALYESLGFVPADQPETVCGQRQSPALRLELIW